MFKQAVLLVLFVGAIGASFAKADVVDPRIVIAEPECQESDVSVTQLNNGFVVIPISGGGSFGFCNNTGVTWTSLLMVVSTTAPASSIDCPDAHDDPTNQAHLAFTTCLPIQRVGVDNVVDIFFGGTGIVIPPNEFGGVPNNERFTVDLNCPEGEEFCIGWPEGTIMAGYANFSGSQLPPPPAIPEQASLTLLGSGLAAVLFKKRIKR